MLPRQKIFRSFHLPDGKLCELREFAQGDLAAILALERRASSSPWSERNFRDSIASSHLCVGVISDGRWLANAVFSLAAGEAELLLIAVDPAFQGRKIATAMLTQMEEILCARAREIFLEVRESNHRAIGLYQSLGFNCLGERPAYYPPRGNGRRENALIFGKHL